MVEVQGILKEIYAVEINSRKHTWIIDEPVSLGGLDKGPKPDEILLSALISCMAITVRMYAERKEWEVNNVEVKLKLGEKIGDKTLIEKTIIIDGDLNEVQLTRLIDVSNRCPMAKLVSNSFEFKLV